jgi:hypothetical protein
MKKIVTLSVFCLVLSGCVTAPIPPDYSGPIARIQDTAIAESTNRAQFYYVRQVDGQKVDNVLFETRKLNRGRGFSQPVASFERNIPARSSTLQLAARIGYGAPIQEITNASTVYTAEKTIKFSPESNRTYVVKGNLTATQQEVWLEDASTGARIE